MREVTVDVDAALAVQDFMWSAPDKLQHSYQLIVGAMQKATAFRKTFSPS